MPICSGITNEGLRCEKSVPAPNAFCYFHDPDRAAERKRNASRAGKSKTGISEIREIKAKIKRLVDDVISGNVERADATVAFQGLGVLARYVEQERKVKETEELTERIAALEEQAQTFRGGKRRWG